MKRLLALLLPILVTVGLLVYALSGVDLSTLRSTLLEGELWVIPPFLILLAFFFFNNALRWTLILRPFGHFSVRQVAPSMMIGFAGNNLLPLRIGELIRTVIFAKESGCSRSGVLMTLVVERALDLVGILLVFVTGALLVGELPPGWSYGLAVALAGILSLLTVLVLLGRFPNLSLGLWKRLSPSLPTLVAERGQTYLTELSRGLGALATASTGFALFLQSLLRWYVAAALVWLSLASYGVSVPPGVAMLVVGVTAAAVSLPSVPGFVGPVQAAFVFALTPFGISQEVALAASILFLVGHWVPVTLTGAIYFVSRHYSYRQIRREAASLSEDSEIA
ncbi:lysylphosphatidylglycerol synthase transmembrane domain-containing protein [Thiocapsa sp.]|uniref:lysylphosphatidylglycerol synthase transmembrane domain-containing protein n=1 Tax=Thiocapsa sp. TaxID=2024551 RepID=UPI0026009544|nr:lysylphosphatidylglycerol synthase transmembrane domain-containing protein [Thiocapsa sp.]